MLEGRCPKKQKRNTKLYDSLVDNLRTILKLICPGKALVNSTTHNNFEMSFLFNGWTKSLVKYLDFQNIGNSTQCVGVQMNVILPQVLIAKHLP